MSGVELRQALAAFVGDDKYRKFVQQGIRRGRMRYWQEQVWSQFTSEHPEFAVTTDELVAVLRVCHLHGDELRPDTVEVIHGHVDWAKWYTDALVRLFPNAAEDVVSTEGRPFESDRIEVWYCQSCREARAAWQSRRGR